MNHSANCCSNAYGFKSEPVFGTLHDGIVLILFYFYTQYTAEAGLKREAKEKYAEISEAIEQAEKAAFDRILDNIASGSKKRLIRMPNNEFDIEMIYLRCRRIAIVLEYFRFRAPKQNAVLKKDCGDVIEMIAFNEYRLTTDKANVSDAADCVLALSDGGISGKDVVGVFSKQHPKDGTIYGENNEELPNLLLNISSYLLKRGEEEPALRLMRYMVECSRRRAGEGSSQHREIVASMRFWQRVFAEWWAVLPRRE